MNFVIQVLESKSVMTKTTKLWRVIKLWTISSLIVLVIGLAVRAYFFLKAPDDVKEWHNVYGQRHRENDQPARIQYDENGEIEYEFWYLNGQVNRENDQPAQIGYDENGEIESEAWYLNGQQHRENDQPALIDYDENGEIEYQAWYLNGQLIKDQPPKPERL